MTVLEIVADVTQRLESAAIPYAVGGSLASSVWGQMRQTNDTDIAIRLPDSNAATLLAAFPDPYYVSSDEIGIALASRDEFRVVQLLHIEEAFKIDLFLLREGPYASSELERARSVEIAPDLRVTFCSPENIILAKLRWYVLWNRVSDRQWNDIVQVLEVQDERLDNAYLDRWAQELKVSDLLDMARSQVYRFI